MPIPAAALCIQTTKNKHMFDTYVDPQIEKQRDVFDPTRRENFQEERIFGLRRRTENAKK